MATCRSPKGIKEKANYEISSVPNWHLKRKDLKKWSSDSQSGLNSSLPGHSSRSYQPKGAQFQEFSQRTIHMDSYPPWLKRPWVEKPLHLQGGITHPRSKHHRYLNYLDSNDHGSRNHSNWKEKSLTLCQKTIGSKTMCCQQAGYFVTTKRRKLKCTQSQKDTRIGISAEFYTNLM